MSSFFLSADSRRKPQGRKRPAPQKVKTAATGEERVGRRRRKLEAEEISSDSEGDGHNAASDEEGLLEDVNQTAFRKATQLLSRLKADVPEGAEDEDGAVAEKLREHAAAKSGKLHRKVAEAIEVEEEDEIRHRAHRFSVLCVAVSPCGRYVVSSGKESTIVKYDVTTQKVLGVINRKGKKGEGGQTSEVGHAGHIYAVAISPDGKLIVSGGHDAVLRVWNFITLALVKELKGHRDAITSLAFRSNSNQLFSASHDRAVRLWDCEQLGFVDTMFGHQDKIVSLSALSRERVLSAGGQDRTMRLWKVEDESQLVFNGPSTCISVECVTMINEDHYASGSSDGSLCIWSAFKKRPTCTVAAAHGLHRSGEPRWLVSLCAVPYTDLLASGSSDGELRLWRVAEDYRSVHPVCTYEVPGFINSIAFSASAQMLVLGVGQEHRFGRWWKESEAKNGVICLPIRGMPNLLGLAAA